MKLMKNCGTLAPCPQGKHPRMQRVPNYTFTWGYFCHETVDL